MDVAAAADSGGRFSLYSTDTEYQVVSAHRGLDRCAALLTSLLKSDHKQVSGQQPGLSGEGKVKQLKSYGGGAGKRPAASAVVHKATSKGLASQIETPDLPFPGASKPPPTLQRRQVALPKKSSTPIPKSSRDGGHYKSPGEQRRSEEAVAPGCNSIATHKTCPVITRGKEMHDTATGAREPPHEEADPGSERRSGPPGVTTPETASLPHFIGASQQQLGTAKGVYPRGRAIKGGVAAKAPRVRKTLGRKTRSTGLGKQEGVEPGGRGVEPGERRRKTVDSRVKPSESGSPPLGRAGSEMQTESLPSTHTASTAAQTVYPALLPYSHLYPCSLLPPPLHPAYPFSLTAHQLPPPCGSASTGYPYWSAGQLPTLSFPHALPHAHTLPTASLPPSDHCVPPRPTASGTDAGNRSEVEKADLLRHSAMSVSPLLSKEAIHLIAVLTREMQLSLINSVDTIQGSTGTANTLMLAELERLRQTQQDYLTRLLSLCGGLLADQPPTAGGHVTQGHAHTRQLDQVPGADRVTNDHIRSSRTGEGTSSHTMKSHTHFDVAMVDACGGIKEAQGGPAPLGDHTHLAADWLSQVKQLEMEKTCLLERVLQSETAYSEARGLLEQAVGQMEEMEAELKELKAEVESSKSEKQRALQTANAASERRDLLEKEFTNFKATHDHTLSQHAISNKSLVEDIKALEEQLSHSKEATSCCEDQLSTLRCSLSSAEEELKMAALSLTGRDTELLQLQDQLLGLRQCLAHLLAGVTDMEGIDLSHPPTGYCCISADLVHRFQALLAGSSIEHFLNGGRSQSVDGGGCHDDTFSLLSGSPDSTATPTQQQTARSRSRNTDSLTPAVPDTTHSPGSAREGLQHMPSSAPSLRPPSLFCEREPNTSKSLTSPSNSIFTAGSPPENETVTSGSVSGHNGRVRNEHSPLVVESLGRDAQDWNGSRAPSEKTAIGGSSVALTGVDGQSSWTTASEVEFRQDLASLDADIERLQMHFKVAMQA